MANIEETKQIEPTNNETTDGDIVGLDEPDDNDNELYDNMRIIVKEDLIKKGYSKLNSKLVKQQADYLVVGYVRESYQGKQTMPKEFYEIFRNYYPNYHLFCCNPNYFLLKPASNTNTNDGNGENENIYIFAKQNCMLSGFLEKLVNDHSQENEIIELNKVPLETFEIILSYLFHHKGVEPDPLPCPIRTIHMEQVCNDKWDATFIDSFTKKEIFEIILAANYLEIKCLLHLGSAKIATLIKQMDQAEINRVIEAEDAYRAQQNASNAQNQDNDNADNDTNRDDVTQID